MTTNFDERNFSVSEAAEHLRISESYVWKLIRKGDLKATRIGRRTIISGAAILRLQTRTAA